MLRKVSLQSPAVKELGINVSVKRGNKLVRRNGVGVMGFGLTHLTARSARRNIYPIYE